MQGASPRSVGEPDASWRWGQPVLEARTPHPAPAPSAQHSDARLLQCQILVASSQLTLFISKISSFVSITSASSTPTCSKQHPAAAVHGGSVRGQLEPELHAHPPAQVPPQRCPRACCSPCPPACPPRHTRSRSPPPSCRACLQSGRAGCVQQQLRVSGQRRQAAAAPGSGRAAAVERRWIAAGGAHR